MKKSTTTGAYFRLLPDWLLGSFCLSIPALTNAYPLVTSDTGAYINTGYSLRLPIDRPILYSLFVRIASMGLSLWGVVAVQTLLLSALLLVITRHFLGVQYRLASFAALMLLLGVASSAGWFSGQIMPDIFTAVLLLCILLITAIPLSQAQYGMICALILGCIMMHNSNLLTALILGAGLLVYCRRKRDRLMKRAALATLGCAIGGWLSLSSMNAIAGHGFRPSAASHVFLMGRMVENGIMDDFLNDYCTSASEPYKLCKYKDALPRRTWDFMWDENGPLYQTGGWQANKEEYSQIIWKTFTTPKYIVLHAIKAVTGTFQQIPLIYVGDGLNPSGENSSPDMAIREHLNNERNQFRTAGQQSGALNLAPWNQAIFICTILSFAWALLWGNAGEDSALNKNEWKTMLGISLSFIVINAFVTATFSTVLGRYESRVIWVLPFLAMLYLIKRLHCKYSPESGVSEH